MAVPVPPAVGVTLVPSDPRASRPFAGAGSPGQLVLVNATNPGPLSNGVGDTVTIIGIDARRPPASGRSIRRPAPSSFTSAADCMVNADPAEGLYSAQFDVTAEYL